MCAVAQKLCAVCAFGDGECLATMKDDYFVPASRDKVKKRLVEGRYKEYTEEMKRYIGETNNG